MALVKYGGGVIQMTGSIAGNTYARNRSGNYVRAKTKPINPNSSSPLLGRWPDDSSQQKVRATLAFLTQEWSQTLTAAQRTAWNLYGANVTMKNKLGEAIHLSGFNHYIRSNSIKKLNEEALISAGPTIFELPEKDPTVAVTIEVWEQRTNLTFDDTMEWVDEDGAAIYIWSGQPQNPQRNYFNGPYLGLKDKAGSSTTPKTSPEQFSNLHIVAEGQKMWYKFRIGRADGRLSEPFYANNIVVAGPLP